MLFNSFSRSRRVSAAACLVLPIAYLAVGIHFRPSAAMVNLGRDATYYYLMNSYLVALGKWAHYWAHPGALLQLFGGAVVRAKLLLFRESGLPDVDELIFFHERYARTLALSLVWANFLCLAWASLAFLRRGVSVAGVVLSQLFFLLFRMNLSFTGLYQPEAFSLGFSALLAVTLIAEERRIAGPAILAGAAIATKMNYASYALLCLLPRGRAAKVGAVLVAVATFFALCLVMYPDLHFLFAHHWQMAIASGDYADGPVGPPTIEFMRERIREGNVFRELAVFPFVLGLGALGLSLRGARAGDRRALGFATAICGFALLTFLRKPTHDYYLMPALGGIPCIVGAYLIATKGNWRYFAGWGAFLLVGAWLWSAFPQNWDLWQISLHAPDAPAARLEKLVEEHKDCHQVLSGPLSLGVDALQMGADWAGDRWSEDMSRIFPRTYFLNPAFEFTHFSYRAVPESDWLKANSPECVLIAINPSIKAESESRLRLVRDARLIECNPYYCAYLYEKPRPRQGRGSR